MTNFLAFGNIILRALEPEDIELLFIWENDSSLWKSSNLNAPLSKYLLEQYLKNATRDIYEQKQLRLIIQTTEFRPVGLIDLFEFDPYHQRAGVGVLIHSTEDRMNGFAFNALLALENYCVNVLGLRQLFANISEENSISIHLFTKAGYSITGIKKKWLRSQSGWKDEWFFQKLLV